MRCLIKWLVQIHSFLYGNAAKLNSNVCNSMLFAHCNKTQFADHRRECVGTRFLLSMRLNDSPAALLNRICSCRSARYVSLENPVTQSDWKVSAMQSLMTWSLCCVHSVSMRRWELIIYYIILCFCSNLVNAGDFEANDRTSWSKYIFKIKFGLNAY